MSQNDELKWMTDRYSWRYIPFRFQALVASITAALLYFEGFKILFAPADSAGQACGSLVRPILSGEDPEDPVGWFWNILGNVEASRCPRTMTGLYWEFFFVAGGLAICGLVLRRAIKRESNPVTDGPEPSRPANSSPGWKDDPFNSFKERWWNGSSWTDQTRYKPGMEPTS